MASFDTRHTEDYSPLVVHFTKNARMVSEERIGEDDPLFAFRRAPARDRLINILLTRTIYASPMPWTPAACRAVCFTECIWKALARLAETYSAYGIVFSKRLIFDRLGGPALYLRGDTLAATRDHIPPAMHPFIAPFDPDAVLRRGVPLDWLHEREWRLPDSLRFEYADIQYVLVESNEDVRHIVHQIGAEHLPEAKMIPMEVYRSIERAWGVG